MNYLNRIQFSLFAAPNTSRLFSHTHLGALLTKHSFIMPDWNFLKLRKWKMLFTSSWKAGERTTIASQQLVSIDSSSLSEPNKLLCLPHRLAIRRRRQTRGRKSTRAFGAEILGWRLLKEIREAHTNEPFFRLPLLFDIRTKAVSLVPDLVMYRFVIRCVGFVLNSDE